VILAGGLPEITSHGTEVDAGACVAGNVGKGLVGHLAALRYLISRLDEGKLGRHLRPASPQEAKDDKEAQRRPEEMVEL
jgi:hypothetical protein